MLRRTLWWRPKQSGNGVEKLTSSTDGPGGDEKDARNPIATLQHIDKISSLEPSPQHLNAYSRNGRNGYRLEEVYDVQHFLGKGTFWDLWNCTPRQGNVIQQCSVRKARPKEMLMRIPLHSYDDVTHLVGEVRALLMLRNVPHIVQIREFFFDFQNPDTRPLHVVTEQLRGEDLDVWAKRKANSNEGMTEDMVLRLSHSLLTAVRYMHERNIVNRGLKVSNLRIIDPNDPSSVMLYDFSLACVLDEQNPKATQDCGNLGYTAPEVLRREPYGVEVDMFSVGGIIFFLLSGYRPFNVPTRAGLREKILGCKYTMVEERWSRVSTDAKQLVRQLLVPRDKRLTVQEALSHSWFRQVDKSPPTLA